MTRISLLLYLLILPCLRSSHTNSLATGKSNQVVGRHGIVASDHVQCSTIGRDVLKEGGHAVDAAVAAALCLGVVNPTSSGIGGGAFYDHPYI